MGDDLTEAVDLSCPPSTEWTYWDATLQRGKRGDEVREEGRAAMREGWFRGDVITVGSSLKASRFPSEFCREVPDAMDCSVSDRSLDSVV